MSTLCDLFATARATLPMAMPAAVTTTESAALLNCNL